MPPFTSKLRFAFVFAVFAILANVDKASAAWLGDCTCNYDTDSFSCHGTWTFGGATSAEVSKKCSDQTSGRGNVINLRTSAGAPPPGQTALLHCDRNRGNSLGTISPTNPLNPGGDIIAHGSANFHGGETGDVCGTIPKGVVPTDTACNVTDEDHKGQPGWCSFNFGTNGCGVGYIRSNAMPEIQHADGSRTVCWSLNNQSSKPRYVDFLILK